jgi:hypothetical protein
LANQPQAIGHEPASTGTPQAPDFWPTSCTQATSLPPPGRAHDEHQMSPPEPSPTAASGSVGTGASSPVLFVSIRSSRAPANPDGHATDAAAHQFQPRTLESTATERDIVTRNRDELDVTHSRFARPGTAILRCGRDDPGGRLAPKEIEHAIDAAVEPPPAVPRRHRRRAVCALLLRAGLAARGCDRPR